MNAEEFEAQVFELIEREAFDPNGIHELLAALPECREDFERIKGALALAEQLPLLEPPAHLDGVLLALAAAQASRTT